MELRPETELTRRCCAGEPQAWDDLFDLYYQPCARFVFQLHPHFTPEDVEEICQETFLSAIRNIQTFKGESQLQTWLFRIAGNKARDYRDHQQAQKRGGGQQILSLQEQDGETGLTLTPAARERGPDQELLKSERGQLLWKALEQLGEPCREIIELRYFGELSYEELAVTLKLNPKTVSSRLSKCLAKLEQIARPIFGGEESFLLPSNL